MHRPTGLQGREGDVGQLRQRDVRRAGDELSYLQCAGHRQRNRRIRDYAQQELRVWTRIRCARLRLLARPAAEYHGLAQAALAPWRLVLEAREVGSAGKDGGRIELVGGEVLAFAGGDVRDPAPRRPKPGN